MRLFTYLFVEKTEEKEVALDAAAQVVTSVLKTNLLQFILEHCTCACSDYFDYSLVERVGISLDVYMVCKAGHLFKTSANLQE
jgi:hypothetical protein